MTYEEIESYAIMHILESDSTEAFDDNGIQGVVVRQIRINPYKLAS